MKQIKDSNLTYILHGVELPAYMMVNHHNIEQREMVHFLDSKGNIYYSIGGDLHYTSKADFFTPLPQPKPLQAKDMIGWYVSNDEGDEFDAIHGFNVDNFMVRLNSEDLDYKDLLPFHFFHPEHAPDGDVKMHEVLQILDRSAPE